MRGPSFWTGAGALMRATNGGCLLGCFRSLENRDRSVHKSTPFAGAKSPAFTRSFGTGRVGLRHHERGPPGIPRSLAPRPTPGAIAVRVRDGAAPGAVLARRLQVRHAGHQGRRARPLGGEHGRACIRFDYSGHGESGGDLRRRARSAAGWRTASRCSTPSRSGPQMLVGSSMGGWLALLLMRALKRRAAPGGGVGRRPGADRAGGRFHRGADVEEIPARGAAPDRDHRRLAAAVAIFRGALSDHPRADRGRARISCSAA